MGNRAFLDVGRKLQNAAAGAGSTVVGGISDPRDPTAGGNRTLVSSSSRVGFLPEFKAGFGDVMEGRISLIMLNSMILALIGFYVWTHNVQGGG